MQPTEPVPPLAPASVLGLLEVNPQPMAVVDRLGRTRFLNQAARLLLGEDAAARLDLEPALSATTSARLHNEVLPRAREGRWRGRLLVRGEEVEVEARPLPGGDPSEPVVLTFQQLDPEERRRTELVRELHTLNHEIATRLLREEDLGEVAAYLLSAAAQLFGSSAAYLLRLRESGTRVFRTHLFSAQTRVVAKLEAQGRPVDPSTWHLRSLDAGEPLVLHPGAPEPRGLEWLPEVGSGAQLVLPARIDGRLENLFCFLRHGAKPWDREIVSLLQMAVDSFAQGVERRIVERKRASIAQDLEISIEREKAAHRYKSEFLANMSHEIRTPMNAILGYAELLSQDASDTAMRAQWTASLRRSTSYLLHLVNDVLDLSKIESGHATLDLQPASLAAVLSDVRDLCAPAAAEGLLDFEVELLEGLPDELETDAVRLQQILVNLVGNAIKYTRDGFVRLRVGTDSGPVPGQRMLVFEVEDSGVGLEPEELDRLFQPFERLTSASRTRAPGTGLGLVISRHLAYLLGGDIEVKSERDRGSTFTLKIPLDGGLGELHSLKPVARKEPRRAPRGLDGTRILIVDDTQENRDVLRFLLENAGARCDEAADGAAGVDAALAAQRVGRPYDLVLMDVNMPVMDGLEATRDLIRRGLEAPIIALTALASSEDEARCRAAGCRDFVRKPILPRAFLETISAHVAEDTQPTKVLGPRREVRGDESVSLLGNPRFQALIDRYVASFPEQILAIREAFEDERMDELRTRVHRLRGTASNYGFPGISQAAGRCEDALRAGATRADIEAELTSLLRGLDRANAG